MMLLWLLSFLAINAVVNCQEAVYTNPIIPGWHSDPSCVFAPDWDNTTFCTTSSFLAFPGCPIFASKDLLNWKLISNALNRPSQLPQVQTSINAQGLGIFASTIRIHNGTFYLITTWVDLNNSGPELVILTSSDPYDDASWADAIHIPNPSASIDPDIFWDEGEQLIVTVAGSPIKAFYVDLATGNVSHPIDLWNGTELVTTEISREAPHLYKKDGYYYLLIAEGGTHLGHSAVIARSTNLRGPWEGSPGNPFVTNRLSDAYFQAVGHADLFHDAAGNWWGVALAVRGGPEQYRQGIYPMGRETVLFPFSWPQGDWPRAQQVSGRMEGPIVPPTKNVSGEGAFANDPDVVDFVVGSSIPRHWVYWRAPAKPASFTVSPPGFPNTLRLTASTSNLTGNADFRAADGLTLVARRQTDTLFEYSVDVLLGFQQDGGDEVGITSFLNQDQHVDLGIVYLRSSNCVGGLQPYFRFRASANGKNVSIPPSELVTVPHTWTNDLIRLHVSAKNETHFQFSAAPAAQPAELQILAVFSTELVSGEGSGSAGLLGVYATTNGKNHTMQAYVSRWRYSPIAQKINYDDWIFSNEYS